jgi:hypothetical protein
LIIYSENGFFICGINILKQYHNSTFGRYGTMANKNFVVHNGLTVGGLSIDAATGNLTTSGSLIVQGDVQVTGTIFDEGAPGATIADATALAIALGG